MAARPKSPTGEITITRQQYLDLHTELAQLRLTVELLGAGIGGLLERGTPPPDLTRARLLELWWLANPERRAIGQGSPQVATTVENVLARHPA